MSHQHHHHEQNHSNSNIRFAFWLNTFFAIIELVGGFYTNSVAILSDAIHDFGDSLSLGLAYYFQKKSERKKDKVYTYGYKRYSILGALITSVVLLIGSIFIIIEAIERFSTPTQPQTSGMIALAVLGIIVNGVAMLRLRKGHSLNERVLSLHFIEDVLGWVAVLVGAIVMTFVDVPILDPILSIAIAAYILFNVYRNVRSAIKVILQAVPENLSEDNIKKMVLEFQEIDDIHDIHVWSLDGEYSVVTFHAAIKSDMKQSDIEVIKDKIKNKLLHQKIYHLTIEFEFMRDKREHLNEN